MFSGPLNELLVNMNMNTKFLPVRVSGPALLAALFALGTYSIYSPLHAAPPERDGLPPGLQKKDKLPPGWQKKVGDHSVPSVTNSTTVTTTTTTITTTTANPQPPSTGSGTVVVVPPPRTPEVIVRVPAPPSTPSIPNPPAVRPVPPTTTTPVTPAPSSTASLTREQRENLARMERALADLEHQASRPAASDRLLHRLSNKQNIALTTLQSELNRNPGVTVPQLYIACIISKEGHLSIEQVLQSHKGGTSWADIAHSHKVQFAVITERLRNAEDAAREAANTEQIRSVR